MREETGPTPTPAATQGTTTTVAGATALPLLTVNLAERRVVYRGVEIPTRPPRNIQRQPLLALAVLAEHAGQTITVDDLAKEMRVIGHLDRRLVTPGPRDLRYKLLAPFRHARYPPPSSTRSSRASRAMACD
jgi:hypothetical protein